MVVETADKRQSLGGTSYGTKQVPKDRDIQKKTSGKGINATVCSSSASSTYSTS